MSETYGLDNLMELCQIVREELEEYNIGRVIARPSSGPVRASSNVPATAVTCRSSRCGNRTAEAG